MLAVHTKVDVANRFPQMTEQISRLARDSATEAARVGAEVAQQRASQRGIGGITAGTAAGSVDGWVAYFVSTHPATWFQSFGTLGNRRRPLKQPPRTNRTRAPGTGIVPLNFLAAGRAAGRRAMLERIAGGLPR